MLEELRIRRALAVDAEIARRVDDAGAEVPFPYTVDEDAERDGLLHDGVGELESAAAFGEGRRRARTQHRKKVARHLVAKVERVAAPAHLEVHRFLGVPYAVHEGIVRRL